MASKLKLEGLAELRAALRQLPEELAGEANAIVRGHAEDAAQRIKRAYPEGPTGNLRGRVTTEQNSSKFGGSAIVRSRAPHAHLHEFGTRDRRTKKGAFRGAMPQAPEHERMIPIAIRVRRNMVRALVDLVRRAGFLVEEP